FEDDFLDYLRGLSFKERRAFDMAMGYVFAKISDLNIDLPKSGLYIFLKASNSPLGAFYNEHRDRQDLFTNAWADAPATRCLDRGDGIFDDGWYEPNLLPPVARWMNRCGKVKFTSPSLSEISLDLTTHIPHLQEQPLSLEVFLNQVKLCDFSLCNYGWLELRLPVPSEI